MNKIYAQWKEQVQLVLQTRRARYLIDDAQPSCVRQPVGSAAWFGLSKTEKGSAFIPWVLVPLVAKLAHFAKFAFFGLFARYPIFSAKSSRTASYVLRWCVSLGVDRTLSRQKRA